MSKWSCKYFLHICFAIFLDAWCYTWLQSYLLFKSLQRSIKSLICFLWIILMHFCKLTSFSSFISFKIRTISFYNFSILFNIVKIWTLVLLDFCLLSMKINEKIIIGKEICTCCWSIKTTSKTQKWTIFSIWTCKIFITYFICSLG